MKTLFLSILAMVLTLAALWYEHRPVPPPHEATWEDVWPKPGAAAIGS